MRLSFIKPKTSDAALILKWRMDEKITRFQASNINPTLDEQKTWLKNMAENDTYEHFLICVDGRPIGYQSFSEIDRVNKKCTSGNYIYADADKIYGGYLHCYLMDYVFYTLGMNKIVNYILEGNERVLKMQKVLKCRQVGILKQHVYKDGKFLDINVFELLESDWQNHPKPFDRQTTLAAFEK
jgi:RimJ/RimL family protein N-acetyltransferase